MVSRKKKVGRPRLSESRLAASGVRHRQIDISRGKQRRALTNCIGRIPPRLNPERRTAAEKSSQAWTETYLLPLFSNPTTGEHYAWSRSQIGAFEIGDEVLLRGGNHIIVMRRGGFKTGYCKALAMKGLCTGIRKWAAVFAATAEKAVPIVNSIKMVLQKSIRLREDYPEIVAPIIALQNEAQRAGRQTYTHGKEELETRMRWGTDSIVFPDIQGAPGRQAIFSSSGLTGSKTRGLLETTADLKDRRPDLLLFDDVETDESATSEIQAPERFRLVKVAMQSGAPGTTMAVLYAGTRIAGDCVCDRVAASPGWHVTIRPAMISLPLHFSETPPEVPHVDLWGEYGELINIRDPVKAQERASRYYAEHRALPECLPVLDQKRPCETCSIRDRCMDNGAIVDWLHGKEPRDASAIEYTMRIYYTMPDMFWSEFQQSPRAARDYAERTSPQRIMHQVNGYPRFIFPDETEVITAGIDVQKHFLFFTIIAWANDFTGYVIDYGTFPDQGVRIFSKANAPHPLRTVFPNMNDEARLQAGTKAALIRFRNIEYRSASGNRVLPIGKILIDAGYGTRLIHGAIRLAKCGSAVEAVKGMYISPGRKPLKEWDTDRPGFTIGDEWFRGPVQGTQEAPHVRVVVSSYKTRLHRALSLAPGTRGSITLFGNENDCRQHELFANHIGGSERPIEKSFDSSGEPVVIWETISGGSDNEGLDSSVYAMAAASVSGLVKRPAIDRGLPPRPQRIIRASPMPLRYDSIYS